MHKNLPQDRMRLTYIFLAFAILALTGCSSYSETAFRAPPPPLLVPDAPREPITTVHLGHDPTPEDLQKIETAAGFSGPEQTALSAGKIKGCSVRHRFDKEALLAYQWGRNRLGVDIDGVGFDSMGIDAVKVEYRLRFSPEKKKKERCRYNSGWQGLIGSGYNEFFVREHDTVWDRLEVLQDDIDTRWKTLTD